MKQSDVQKLWDEAMLAVNQLSVAAKSTGDARTMYAANRAWRELFATGRPVDLQKTAVRR